MWEASAWSRLRLRLATVANVCVCKTKSVKKDNVCLCVFVEKMKQQSNKKKNHITRFNVVEHEH